MTISRAKDDGVRFAYFTDQKVKPCGDFGILSTPPQFNKEIEEVECIVRPFKQKTIPSQNTVKDFLKEVVGK